MGFWIFLALVLVVVVVIATLYNRIITLENRFENAWGQIDVQLKRRADLVPNLVETVKGYASHEQEVFDAVSSARSAMMQAKSPDEGAAAANVMDQALGRLFAISEAYPELKANENFVQLQKDLGEVEAKIAYARQFYNDAVLQYNNAIETVPGVFLAGPMGKKEHVFLEIPDGDRVAPTVSFGGTA